MSNSGKEYCRRDRLSYRQNQQIAGAASASDHYHIPSYDAPSIRNLPVYEQVSDSRRLLSSSSVSAPVPSCEQPERHLVSAPFNVSDKFHLHNGYNLPDHRLPPLPPSPNHYVLDSEETFIPPPDCYLSPPAPAPPDRFQGDRFLLPSGELYLASSSVEKYKNSSNGDRMHERYSSDEFSSGITPDNQLDRYSNRYTGSYAGGLADSYLRQDFGYLNQQKTFNSNYYTQKANYASQRFVPSGVRPSLHNPYPTLRIQKCCTSSYHGRDSGITRDVSPGTQSRMRSNRTSSPVSVVTATVSPAIPTDLIGPTNSGRFSLSTNYSTLPRCNSYGDVQHNPTFGGTLRRTPVAHENCCFKRRTSSPSSTSSYGPYSVNYPPATTTVSASSSVSSISSQHFHQQQLPTNWKPGAVNVNVTNSGVNLQNNLSTQVPVSASASNSNCGSNVNSPSLSFSSSKSSPSLTTISATNTASATTSPTAISTNSGSSGAAMDPHSQTVQWSNLAYNPTDADESTKSPNTETVDDSPPSTVEATSPSHHRSTAPHPKNPPTSLPVQSSFDRPYVKHALQHQISVPVTATEVASTRRYSRSISKKELMKNFIKKETAVFFGVHEPTEEIERARWLDRTKRLACRTYGKLKNEYQFSSSSSTLQKPDVLPSSSLRKVRSSARDTDEQDGAAEPSSIESTLKRKPSVAKMTLDGMAYVVSTLGRHKRRASSTSRQWSRSYAPSTVPPTPSSPLDDEVFFDRSSAEGINAVEMSAQYQPPSTVHADIDQVDSNIGGGHHFHSVSSHRIRKEKHHTWRRVRERSRETDESPIGLSRIWGRVLDRVLDNSDRRQYGMGVVGKFFGRSLKRSVVNREPVKEQLEDLEDHRPFFTYWVTTVQILILVLSIFAYGLGPVGFDLAQRSGLVLVTSLSLQQVEYSEPSNFWIGPRAADLIHMGAKFAPCMRKDKKIMKEIEKVRDRERGTACCIRNDDSGCVQASKEECSQTISTWKKWSKNEAGIGGRTSGSVCGLDPKFCEAPASVAPYEWPDDITKWPICRKVNSRFSVQTSRYDQSRFQKDKMTAEHMVCEVIGHPCCIGIHGTCRITTKEYCDFVRGYFHEEASLCSQVSCLDDVCGMIPFYFPEVPDQFYRLWTSLFLHAGIIHLTVTVFIQYFLMRDLEKLTGSVRIGFIYIGSGVAGNLASAIFVPYRADVGPAGAQFGLLACLIVEVLNCWPMLKHPFQALFKLLTITFMLFLFGLLPWVDNFAHLFGFIFGFLLSYALLPFVSFGPYDRQKKIFLIWVCLLSSLFLFILLVLLFYLIPIYDCEFCQYFNCIPLTRDFCASQNINFKREEYVV